MNETPFDSKLISKKSRSPINGDLMARYKNGKVKVMTKNRETGVGVFYNGRIIQSGGGIAHG